MTAVYLFGGILAFLLLVVVLAPLVERDTADPAPSPEARKRRALEALRELEFEFETGKLAPEDYRPLRERWAREAIAARDALGETPEGATCPGCGAGVRPGQKFCAECGSRLPAAAAGEGGPAADA